MKIWKLFMIFSLWNQLVVAQQREKEWSYEEVHQRLDKEANDTVSINTVGILVYDGFFELDAIGPQAALSSVVGTKVFFVAPEKGIIKGSHNVYHVNQSIDEVNHLDVLIVPGGLQPTYMLTKNEKVLHWIRRIDSTSTYTGSVCTGSWVLGAAGLLKGKNATTNWYRAKEMLEEYGAVFQEKRWVRDGKYWTAAGVSAGIDMGLAMLMEAKGKTHTSYSMLHLEYDPHPPLDGGSIKKTNSGLVKMLTEIYDMRMDQVRERSSTN